MGLLVLRELAAILAVIGSPTRTHAVCAQCSVVYDVLMHHWRKGDKDNHDFVAKYPYVVSNEKVIKYMVETNLTDEGLKNRILVMDSAFTSVNVFRMLLANGCNGVGSVKFPFAGVPQALLWNKKDLKKKSGPRVQPGDCLHLRSLTDGRKLGVQQVMVRAPLTFCGSSSCCSGVGERLEAEVVGRGCCC